MTKLTSFKELTIVHHVVNLDLRGFLLTKTMLCAMANQLLKVRGDDPIRVC